MNDTEWQGKGKKMNFELGVRKGMWLILQERGVDVTGMGAEKMRSVLAEMDDLSMKGASLNIILERRGTLQFFC